MCGIVGLTFHNEPKTDDMSLRTKVGTYMFTKLLRFTVERGEDATGIAVLHDNGYFATLRDAVSSPKFILTQKTKEAEQKDNKDNRSQT